jgi:predicted nucleic acid-binding protein
LRFWDTSAVVPLLVSEPQTAAMMQLLSSDNDQTVWWGTRTECVSAVARNTRQRIINSHQEAQARVLLHLLSISWDEVLPTYWVRAVAEVLVDNHPLRAADALQLAAAFAWCAGQTRGREFVCLDRRLRDAARSEGFTVLP